MAIAALGGVAYGVVEIVQTGTDGSSTPKAPLKPQLRTLADAQEQLAVRLENLKAGRRAPRLLPAIRRARRAQQTAVAALRERQVKRLAIPHEGLLQDALDAEFDYLDAIGSVARSSHSPLIKKVADRAQKAKDAFTALPDSQGVEDGVRSTQAFLTWANAR